MSLTVACSIYQLNHILQVGIVIFFVLPDTPSEAWFLSPHERKIVHLRTIENQTGADTKSKDIDWYQILEGQSVYYPFFEIHYSFSNDSREKSDVLDLDGTGYRTTNYKRWSV